MEKCDKILEELQSLIAVNENGEKEFANVADKRMFAALIQTVPDEVAQKWLDSGRSEEYPMNFYLRGKINFKPGKERKWTEKVKRPISEVIFDFNNKRSGKRAAARDELFQRFTYLDWKEQLDVFEALLVEAVSYKSYREWVFKTLRSFFWDNMEELRTSRKSRKISQMQKKVREICETSLSEFYPALFAIKKLDYDFILSHKEQLISTTDYPTVANRLLEMPDFKLDRNLMSKSEDLIVRGPEQVEYASYEEYQKSKRQEYGFEYFHLLARHHRKINEKEVRALLYEWLLNNQGFSLDDEITSDLNFSLSLMHDACMSQFIMDLGRSSLWNLLLEFRDVEKAANDKLRENLAFIKSSLSAEERSREIVALYRKLLAKEALERYYYDDKLKALRQNDRIEFYRELARLGLPADKEDGKAYFLDMIREPKALTLDRKPGKCRLGDFTLRFNDKISKALETFKALGWQDIIDDFDFFESMVRGRYDYEPYEIIIDKKHAEEFWQDYLEKVRLELSLRDSPESRLREMMSRYPDMKSFVQGLDLQVYDDFCPF